MGDQKKGIKKQIQPSSEQNRERNYTSKKIWQIPRLWGNGKKSATSAATIEKNKNHFGGSWHWQEVQTGKKK